MAGDGDIEDVLRLKMRSLNLCAEMASVPSQNSTLTDGHVQRHCESKFAIFLIPSSEDNFVELLHHAIIDLGS